MEVEKVPFSECLEDFGLLQVGDFLNHPKMRMKRLEQVVASSTFLRDLTHV